MLTLLRRSHLMSDMQLKKISESVENLLSKKYPSIYNSKKTFFSEAKRLSDLFTRGRSDIAEDYLASPETRAAYLAHFTLTNAAKVFFCLDQFSGFLNRVSNQSIRVLDLGCGSGSAALATSLYFDSKFKDFRLDITCVDKSTEILKDAEALASSLGNRKHSFRFIEEKIEARRLKNFLGNGRFDIVIAANLLNEVGHDYDAHGLCRELIVHHLENSSDRPGIMIIIDPALRETTRSIMALRDRLIHENVASAISPCLHNEPCPMLRANDKDWCHFYLDWEMPEIISEIDAAIGTDHRYLKMAYLILTAHSYVCAKEFDTHSHRVVSSPLSSKGKTEIVLCGIDGKLRRLTRLDRDLSNKNSDLDHAKRGDIVRCAKDNRIGKYDAFELACSAGIYTPPFGCLPIRSI